MIAVFCILGVGEDVLIILGNGLFTALLLIRGRLSCWDDKEGELTEGVVVTAIVFVAIDGNGGNGGSGGNGSVILLLSAEFLISTVGVNVVDVCWEVSNASSSRCTVVKSRRIEEIPIIGCWKQRSRYFSILVALLFLREKGNKSKNDRRLEQRKLCWSFSWCWCWCNWCWCCDFLGGLLRDGKDTFDLG